MQLRQLGGSGLRVSRFTLGTMTWGYNTDAYDAEDQLTTFLQMGGTTIDTAPIYGGGHAEKVLGSALTAMKARDEVVIAGKAGIRFTSQGSGTDCVDASRRTLLNQLEQSLRDLQTDHLDLWQIHRWDPTVPLDEVLSALEFAVSSGRARYVGVSNFASWQVTAARLGLQHSASLQLLSNQVEYSLLAREIEGELADAMGAFDMSVLAWSPLAGGVLTGKYRGGVLPAESRAADPARSGDLADKAAKSSGVVEAIAKAADGLGVTAAHVALAWVADRPLVASTLVGARVAAQLAENLEADQIVLPPEISDALDDVSGGT